LEPALPGATMSVAAKAAFYVHRMPGHIHLHRRRAAAWELDAAGNQEGAES